MESIASGKTALLITLNPLYVDNKTSLTEFIKSGLNKFKKEPVQFDQFGVICEGNCYGDIAFAKQKSLVRKIPKKSGVLSLSKFWFQTVPNFATLRFSKYIGCFVASGVFELETRRFKKLELLKSLQYRTNMYECLGWTKGNLFSFVFLSQQRFVSKEVEHPTKTSAFVGTCAVLGFLMTVAFVTLAFEVMRLELSFKFIRSFTKYIDWECKPQLALCN